MNLAVEHANILVYGAHLVALECYRHLCVQGLGDQVIGFAVTDLQDNPMVLAGKPVKTIADYSEYARDCLVMIAIPQKFHKQVRQHAEGLGFQYFEEVSLEEISQIKGERFMTEFKKRLPFGLSKSENDPTWLDADFDNGSKRGRCKYPTLFYLDDDEMARYSEDLQQAYREELGDICGFEQSEMPGYDCTQGLEDAVRIYMIFDRSVMQTVEAKHYDPWIVPLWAGCNGDADKTTYLRDDSFPENISDRNLSLAEMTGAYWIWKQAPQTAYKGLCHYRRHYVLSEAMMRGLRSEDVDVLLTTPRFVPGGIRGMFTAETPVKEPVLATLSSAMEQRAPQDRKDFEEYLKGHFYFPNNMVVAKSEIYDAYCEWIFPILLRMLEIDEEIGYGHENDRHVAYAAELLTSFYFIKRKSELRITFTDYQFMYDA